MSSTPSMWWGLCALAVLLAAEGLTAPAPALRVLKHGEQVFIRAHFSPTEDLVVRVGKGGVNYQFNYNSAYLVPVGAGMTVPELTAGRLIHGNGDDATPWNLNGTYIGANHGCSDARELTCENHGLTVADLGSEWTDAAGTKFCLLKIADANHLWVLAANAGAGDIWKFTTTVAGTSLQRPRDGATLSFSAAKMVQLTPACRISRQEYLVDGQTPLADDQAVTCASLDLVEDYDVISPASVVSDCLAHPGVARSFVGPDLAAVVSNHIIYRFLPNGANVIHHTAQARQDFNLGYMGFVQTAKLTTGTYYTTHDYYIPKTVPFTQNDVTWDFRARQNYNLTLPAPLIFSAANKNVADPADLPERFIQVLGRKQGEQSVPEVGFAVGYSLLQGMTVPAQRAANAAQALMLYTSSKTYPTAADSKLARPIKAGTEFTCVAYRQYFWPGAQPQATCFYWHPEGDETVVYADYHRRVDRDVLQLPAEFTGKALRVVEKTPSVTLHTARAVPAAGLEVSVDGDYGSLVVAVR